jgi:hypothetical protein
VWVCGRWVDGSSRGWWYEEYGEYGSESMKSTQPSYETASTRQPASDSQYQTASIKVPQSNISTAQADSGGWI